MLIIAVLSVISSLCQMVKDCASKGENIDNDKVGADVLLSRSDGAGLGEQVWWSRPGGAGLVEQAWWSRPGGAGIVHALHYSLHINH